jgi:hypothetical protein
VDGTWNFEMSSPQGAVTCKVTMKAEGGTLTGEFDMGGGRVWPIEKGTVDGNDVTFEITRDGASMTYAMKGRLEGDTIKGAAAAMGVTVDWVMVRAK